MRIAFVGYAYHSLTKSSDFFLKILSGIGQVSCFYEDDGGDIDHRPLAFNEFDYDLIVVWQIHQVLRRLSGRHPNVVFVPMYDAMRVGTKFYWDKSFGKAKILSFSRKLHEEAIRRGAVSEYFKFFPNPSHWETAEDYKKIRAFFWYRKKPVDAKMVFTLCGANPIEEFLLHNAPDPGERSLSISVTPPSIRRIEIFAWIDDFDGYKDVLRRCNLFFASRLFEGIGMGFLEAMACGLCVVAPDNPTMNEYIENGVTGIMYPPAAPGPLNFDGIRDIGLRARASIELGFECWKKELPALVDFVATPKPPVPRARMFARWRDR